MGRGKSSAAIQYMNETAGRKRFLYVTPYLKEVDRVCECCDFDQPDDTHSTKSSKLKAFLRSGKNVAATHALFVLLDDEALGIVEEKGYCLIVDESVEVFEKLMVSASDLEIVKQTLADVLEDGKVVWRDRYYSGQFNRLKEVADAGQLYCIGNAFFKMLNPKLFSAFDEIYMLTYLFAGQTLSAYLEYFQLPYRVIGIQEDQSGYRFSSGPDRPPPIDYRSLIHVLDDPKMNSVGDAETALSKTWYQRRGSESEGVKAIRKHLRSFFEYNKGNPSKAGQRLWTCFSDDRKKIAGKQNRYISDWLQVNARATNEYRGRDRVAYLVNRYDNPTKHIFFAERGCTIDDDVFALSEMLQWIWRSAIRDGKPIELYIPSARMRRLLNDWMDQMGAQSAPSNQGSAS